MTHLRCYLRHWRNDLRYLGYLLFDFLETQPRFFRKENRKTIAPNPATIAAAVKPAVEISARE